MCLKDFHDASSGLKPAWSPRSRKSSRRAPESEATRGAIWGAHGLPVRLVDGLIRTEEGATSVPAEIAYTY